MTEVKVMLTDEQGKFVSSLVEDGYYSDAGEVMAEALAKMKRDDEEKLVALRQAIDDGEASGVYEGDAFASVYAEMGWERKV